MAYIVADDRERNVHPHLAGLLPGRVQKHRISIGDFLICRPGEAGAPPTVVACIERKTYADFAATLKGPRYANREKMFHLRSQTGCQLYYLVEGPAFPSPNGYIKGGGGMKYQSILSAMTTLPLASGVHIMQTSDTAHTALRLRDMVAALDKIPCPYTYPVEGGGAAAAQPAQQPPNPPQPVQQPPHPPQPGQQVPPPVHPPAAAQPAPLAIPDLVTGTYETDPDTQCMELWKKMTGISQDTAKVLVKAHSLCEFMATRPNVDQIKTPTGRLLVKKGRDSLKALQLGKLETAAKVLSGVNGLTLPTASEILLQINAPNPLYALGTGSPYRAAELTITQKSRKIRLGAKKVERIQRLLNWKSQDPGAALGAPAPAPPAPPAPPAAPPSAPPAAPPSAPPAAPPSTHPPATCYASPASPPSVLPASYYAPPAAPPSILPAAYYAPPAAPPSAPPAAPPSAPPTALPGVSSYTRPGAAPTAMATADAPAAVVAKIQALPPVVPMHTFAAAAQGQQALPRADAAPSAQSDKAAAYCATADLDRQPAGQTKRAAPQPAERDHRAETPPEVIDELFYKAMGL